MKLSILMANYNNGKYIKQAIESVINQSDKNWELIIVDDDSKDNSINIIRPYLKDKRIKLIQHKKNKGYASSLKTAIDKSTGEIIGRLDADDALHKDAVKIMLNAHKKNPNYGLIYSTYYNCNGKLEPKSLCCWVKKIEKGKTNLHKIRVSHFETFKKSAYEKTEGFDPKQKKAVDKDLIFKLEEVTKLRFINKPLYYYRFHDKGISQGKGIAEARIYSIIAEYHAYMRRLKNKKNNLTSPEIIIKINEAIKISKDLKKYKMTMKLRLFFIKIILKKFIYS